MTAGSFHAQARGITRVPLGHPCQPVANPLPATSTRVRVCPEGMLVGLRRSPASIRGLGVYRVTDKATKLSVLHDEINACRVCEESVGDFSKPNSMKRGEAGDVVIVGESPGATEVETQTAFSGPAGKRLNEWLIKSGAAQDAPRGGVYLTSVVKCRSNDKAAVARMAKNCTQFLRRQINTIAPNIVITLGQFAYEALDTQLRWRSAVGSMFESQECWLVSPFDVPFKLLVWPHPSGLSRWTNVEANRQKLEASFELIRSVRMSQDSE